MFEPPKLIWKIPFADVCENDVGHRYQLDNKRKSSADLEGVAGSIAKSVLYDAGFVL